MTARLVLGTLLPAVAALISACSTASPPTSPASRVDSNTEASVATPTGSARPCTRRNVASLVRRFVRAFNRGDADRLERLFAREPDFEWYSTNGPGERLHQDAYDRSTLVRYFAARHARGERLVVRWFRFNGNTGGDGAWGNFQYSLVRSADDLEPTRYHGKGAARCYENGNVIFVWSMGREVREEKS